MDFVILNFT